MKKIRFSELVKISDSIGIDIIGFTDKYDSEHIRQKLRDRINKNFHTEFEHPLEERVAPEKILKGWKSIISIGLPYENSQIKINSNSFSKSVDESSYIGIKGFISKSAVGLDYHIKLKNIMSEFVEKLMLSNSFDYYIGVDTTPLLDREIAYGSGVGFYGKNNSIINEKYGSKIFLGYIIVDFEIIDDVCNKPLEDPKGCGDCNLCLISCPTGSISEGRLMNSKICLSYLTQTKEYIPFELREKMGSMIYGCDICTSVCPYNSKTDDVSKNSVDFKNAVSNIIDLEELLFMSNRQFKEKFGKTAISWRGKNVLRRNAVIALSKIESEKAVSILKKLIFDDSRMIRQYAVWALYKKDRELAFELSRLGSLSKDSEKEMIEELERIEEFYAG